jgi:hypothetical protein
MPKKEKYIRKSLAGGFALSFKNIIYVTAFWISITVLFYVLNSPFAATVNGISGSSDISADAANNPDIKGYFLIDMLPGLTDRLATAMNPALLISGFLTAFAIGVFFTSGFLEAFKRSLTAESDTGKALKKSKAVNSSSFAYGGLQNFWTMLMFFLLGATGFLLLSTVTASAGRFLKAVAWGMTGSEAAAYYTGVAVRIIYYVLFLYLTLILQYARIASVFNAEPAENARMRSVIRFKDGLWHGYDFLSENKRKAVLLFLIILAATAAWFIIDHIVFFKLTENASLDPLIWSALTGLGYIFFRIVQYATAAVFFFLQSK